MATIKDIAKITGVSTATVSNVLNGKAGAAGTEKTQEILSIARKLHYTPNSLAKNLKQRRTKSIGIITEDLTVFNTAEIVDGIEGFCEKEDYDIILGNMRLFQRYNNDFTDTPQHQKLIDRMVNSLLSKQVEGLVYIGYHCREINYLPSILTVPLVYAYCFPKRDEYSSVTFDDRKAAFEIANLLIEKGHTNIGVIAGPPNSYHTINRMAGFQKALFENAMLFNVNNAVYGDWEIETGYKYCDKMLESGVTAIFCFNDLIASGVYARCIEKNIVIGKDISLIGFDNRNICKGYYPHISTAAPPLSKIGEKSAEIVLREINAKKSRTEKIFLDCDLIITDSITSV